MKTLLVLAVLATGFHLKRCTPENEAPAATQAQPAAVDSTYYQAQQAWHGTPPQLPPDTSTVQALHGGNLSSANDEN